MLSKRKPGGGWKRYYWKCKDQAKADCWLQNQVASRQGSAIRCGLEVPPEAANRVCMEMDRTDRDLDFVDDADNAGLDDKRDCVADSGLHGPH